MGSKRRELVSVLLLMIIFSILSPNIVKTVTAKSEDYMPLLSMPKEYINYTIVLDQQGRLWAIVDGYYPINLAENFTGNLPLLYPMPPQTTNISVSVNDMQIEWSNFTQSYPSETHHTAIGNWWMIYFDPMVVSNHFTLKIHYEHPLEKNNGSYFFLYDLNISPYLSPQGTNSTAYFQIDIQPNFTDMRVFNTVTDSKWNPIMYNLTKTVSSCMISIEAFSEYGKPLLGDLVVEFSIKQVSEFPWVAIAVVVAVVIAVASLLVYFKKH